jgi:WD40 repeat protein
VRSHAKAAPAGLNQRQAAGPGRILGGALPTRDASPRAKGSSASAVRQLFLCALAGSLALLALAAAPANAVAPTIKAAWSQDVVFKEAILKAEINPEGLATTYHFDWGLTLSYGNSSAERNVGEDSEDHKVALFLDDLQPGTTYHYRVVATNGDGVDEGVDHTFTTYQPFASGANCANQVFRIGLSARLPDCRAYEMVSPVDKGGGPIDTTWAEIGHGAFDQAAIDGSKITYSSATSFGDAASSRISNQYLSTRGAAGWSTHGISSPLQKSVYHPRPVPAWDFATQFKSFSDDLSSAWMRDQNVVPLTSDAEPNFANLYRRDNLDDTYHDAVITSEPLTWGMGADWSRLLGRTGAPAWTLTFRGRSEDGSHVVFTAGAQLTPDALAETETRKLYEWTAGGLRLVSVLPDGTPNPLNSYLGTPTASGPIFNFDQDSGKNAPVLRAVSEDGSRIFWSASSDSNGNRGKVYVRIDGQTTVAVSESVTPNPSFLWTASVDGSKAVFSFDPDGAGPMIDDLYEFDVDTETPTLIAHEAYGVAGSSDDLSNLYFVSQAALDAGATVGEPNLYLRENGTTTFIATTNLDFIFGVPSLVGPHPHETGTRVTSDGRRLAFMSNRSLTGYDNTDAVTGKAAEEVFLYDADADELTCISCNPSGARPHGGGTRLPYSLGKPESDESAWWTAAYIPTWEQEQHAAQVLSEDGNRLFFNAIDPLVPWDINGVQDVYQWEAQGTGHCQEARGCINLISTGTSPTFSEFVDASADGSDVFIRTESSIDLRDPGLLDIYDARQEGGLPPPPPPPPPCLGDACQGIPDSPNDPTPASASFRGAGDPAPAKPRRSCKARKRLAAKGSRQAKRKAARRCRGGNRRSVR